MKLPKFIASLFTIALTFTLLTIFTGCVSGHRKSFTQEETRAWVPNTNHVPWFVAILKSNPYGILISETNRVDFHKAGGIANMTASEISGLAGGFTNQTALGGGSAAALSAGKTDVSTNADKVITATGTASGQVLDGAAKLIGKPSVTTPAVNP